MKPKDLQLPFPYNKWKLLIKNQIFYVPSKSCAEETFIFPGWEAIFGNNHPVKLEYCSGNGTWIAKKAQKHPEYNWVALEKKYTRVRKIWAKSQNYELKNLFILAGEGLDITKRFIPRNSLSEVFINFPDPWPKRRDHKHRIIQESFLKELACVMEEKAQLTVVTDDEEYSKAIIKTVDNSSYFTMNLPSPYYKTDYLDYGSSYFEELWKSQGKEIRYHIFENKEGVCKS